MTTQIDTFILAGNGSYENRGCEGIVRGTVAAVREYFPDATFISANFGPYPPYLPIESDPGILHRPIPTDRYSPYWLLRNGVGEFGRTLPWFPGLSKYAGSARAILALGGDNYTMSNQVSMKSAERSVRLHLSLIDYAHRQGLPLIIWGASIGPFDRASDAFRKQIVERLKSVHAILVREDMSQEYLASLGIVSNVRRVVDPAFLMAPEQIVQPLLPFDIPADAIGLNFSPTMARHLSGSEDTTKGESLLANTVEQIVRELKRPVVLTPHVLTGRSNDLHFLRRISELLDSVREYVYLLPIEELSAAQVKWAISQYACFAGARTHSTIAALSSCVPTLSFAYSVKAYGINRDMYGHTDYVIAPENMEPQHIVSKLKTLIDESSSLRMALARRVAFARREASAAGEYLRQVVERRKLD